MLPPSKTPFGAALGIAAALLVLAACSGSETPAAVTTSTATPSQPPVSTTPPRADVVAAPDRGVCYDLTYEAAIAPTATGKPVSCKTRHSAETYAVGTIANLVDGHLLAVDSQRVQEQVARSCPARLGKAVGGSAEDLRLSMLRAVWFTPTVAESDSGADWFRCDLVALAGEEDLAPVKGSLLGVLDDAAGRDAFGMCGTAGPDDPAFERVPCRAGHSWRAFSVIEVPGRDYPGRGAITDAGEQPCKDGAGDLADDPLDFEWGFEGPDKSQWDAGQTFVRCWAPD